MRARRRDSLAYVLADNIDGLLGLEPEGRLIRIGDRDAGNMNSFETTVSKHQRRIAPQRMLGFADHFGVAALGLRQQ